ncbi:Uncharacterized protein APZ42_016592 [Daphnia magna]|uniref:Uncharacterized protein n=1 Tax=Daphnia magna TaxID=35525 RepID=A0A165AHX4_9CRUS|nr:Uncharacterized protein APZ42_016592 [Daphnia magna]
MNISSSSLFYCAVCVTHTHTQRCVCWKYLAIARVPVYVHQLKGGRPPVVFYRRKDGQGERRLFECSLQQGGHVNVIGYSYIDDPTERSKDKLTVRKNDRAFFSLFPKEKRCYQINNCIPLLTVNTINEWDICTQKDK